MSPPGHDGHRALPPLRWLDATAVAAAMPPLEERLRLAERTLRALATPGAAELPAKIGLHPRPATSFAHAMPAHLRGDAADDDLLGVKWIAGFATNNARSLPALNAVVLINDPDTGIPMAILDGGPITAQRTAAVTGVAIRHFASAGQSDVAIIGGGVQGRAHLPVFGGVLPGCTVHVFDRHPDRADALADEARATPGVEAARTCPTARDAVEAADIVVTAASFASPSERQVLTNEWLRPGATVIPVDYATYVGSEVARDAALFLVDERAQFLANRELGAFDGYPDPTATIGEALVARTPRPDGRVVITHLGVGLSDVVFGDAILKAAIRVGLGTTLSR